MWAERVSRLTLEASSALSNVREGISAIRNVVRIEHRIGAKVPDKLRESTLGHLRNATDRYRKKRKAPKDLFPDGLPDELRGCFPVVEEG